MDATDIDDDKYVYNLFLTNLEEKKYKEGKENYYYQYEYDSNSTLYESLMDKHHIAIKSKSLKEAKVLNAILRCMIDE